MTSRAYRGIRVVEMGVCYKSSSKDFSSCALTEDDCKPDEFYEGQVQDSKIMKRCDPNDAPIGRCLQENVCALRDVDCSLDQSTSNFDNSDEFCTNQRDKSIDWDIEDPAFSQFGSCKDTSSAEYFCIYDPSDCNESGTEVYATPSETLAAGIVCDCSQVHVWGCRTNRHSFCATNNSSFSFTGCVPSSPHAQRSNRAKPGSDGLDCRLCRKRNTAMPTAFPTTRYAPSTSPVTSPPTFPPPTFSPSNNPASTLEISSQSNKSSSNSHITAAIIGAGTGSGVVVIAVAVALVVYWKAMTKKQKEIRKTKSSHHKPPASISLDLNDTQGNYANDTFEVDSALSVEDHIGESNWDDEKN